ncbi:uncharacterized protein A1O5_00982 [Cladophialophora psammophila CBS 110553]|uniref:Xylanolytic transcriptional activator regulatory domain-containing protein n=1 Tax=Cladophialophora psammophila CBS 110553 TaxID=1182543 RepID=W9Y1Y7_9EURO|nr:uncharacterized protein A1O5_00982 [Cladophialophora psammophila CBS 110553]EXJ76474.1 hypothetical protein A1O5_00982 [Cladophialophora psammophila CBS 110553]
MDDGKVLDLSRNQQKTICPRDICLMRDGILVHRVTKKDECSASSAIRHISIPYDESDELSETESTPPSVSDPGSEETFFEHDCFDIHDVLFDSIGLERVYECWQKLHERREVSVNDDFQMSEVLLLSKSLRDELIEVYFRQFHPICPAVDRTGFLRWYQAPEQDATVHPQLMQLVFLSILFAALSHVDENLLRREPCGSVKHAQKALFSSAQNLYHHLEQEFTGAEHLAQSALLLSYWSPCDSIREVNSYWVEEAIRHAVAGGMSDLSFTHHRRIIWWCCIIRNRMISLGLRRFSRLERRPEGRLPEITDFCDDSSGHHLISIEANLYFTRAFILLCKLTKIMVDSVRLKDRDYNDAWAFPRDQRGFDMMEEVGKLDEKLKVWGANFAHLYASLQDMNVPSTDLVIFHLIGLMHQYVCISQILWELRY